MTTLNGWHRGERAIQQKLGFDGPMNTAWTWIEGELPEQHRVFHTTRLPFLPVTTLDARGRPWGSILAGHDGAPGFIASRHYSKLLLRPRIWAGDPFVENAKLFGREKGKRMLIAGIGIEFSTRRRNKLAGWVESLKHDGDAYEVAIIVNEAIGNCPKYINIRDLVPRADTNSTIIRRCLDLAPDDRLPDEIIEFIHASDTVFLGSSYEAPSEDRAKFPSHLGMNQRGGRPGFMRVSPEDKRTVFLPDYSGNRLLTSLGNIEATPRASLTYVSFTSGAVLYLTGDARTLVSAEAQHIMPLQHTLTAITTTGFIFVSDALPVRQRPNTPVERSPYSPPIKLLATEAGASAVYFDTDDVRVTLARLVLHSPDIATLTFTAPGRGLCIVPGQTAILDFTSFVGARAYQHMASLKPTSVNDDRIRTWTISHADAWATSGSENAEAREFSLTMRRVPGGTVTEPLFAMAHQIAQLKPTLLADARPLGLSLRLVGISGDFVWPPGGSGARHKEKLLWFAGGMGVTPFLAMLSSFSALPTSARPTGVTLVLSTREPAVLLPLIAHALRRDGGKFTTSLRLEIFSNVEVPKWDTDSVAVQVTTHQGRISHGALNRIIGAASESDVYLCGPPAFEETVLGAMLDNGISIPSVKREKFTY